MYLSVYKSVNYSYQDVHTITKMWMEAKCPLLDEWIKMGVWGGVQYVKLLSLEKEWNSTICTNTDGPVLRPILKSSHMCRIWKISNYNKMLIDLTDTENKQVVSSGEREMEKGQDRIRGLRGTIYYV